jgi:hypothetical protein
MNGVTVFEKSAQSARVWTIGRAMMAVLSVMVVVFKQYYVEGR